MQEDKNTLIPSSSSSEDRTYDEKVQAMIDQRELETSTQAQVQQEQELEKTQQQQDDEQRRLDGRLVSFGHKEGEEAAEYKQLELKRERINEAYTAPSSDHYNKERMQSHNNEAIDLVV